MYFVVATNLEQLGHSIRAVYGEQFDSERYLKRFFDQEYLLPSPDNTRFTQFLFEQYSLNDFGAFYTPIESNWYNSTPSDQALFQIMCDGFKQGPRDQEQIANTLQATLSNWPTNEHIHLAYLLFLIIAKQASTSLFQQLAENRFADKTKFDENLRKYLRYETMFKTRDIGGTNEQSIAELLWIYQSLTQQKYSELCNSDWDIRKFPEKIFEAICRDMPHYWQGAEPTIPLKDYARRISQAGQLKKT